MYGRLSITIALKSIPSAQRAIRVPSRSFTMSAVADATERSPPASPPSKRARQESPTVDASQIPHAGESSQSHEPANGKDDQSSRPFRRLGPKEQARRVKALVRDRQKSTGKFGEQPIFFDICEILGQEKVDEIVAKGPQAEFELKYDIGHELECTIERLSAHGEGLARSEAGDWVIAVPFVLPGERVRVRVVSNERMYSPAVLVQVVEPAKDVEIGRRDDLVRCRYYGSCSGCQYQHITYADQLAHKQKVVERAFRHYSRLPSLVVPAIGETLPSPLQYGYRTKLTPHFDLPFELRRRRKDRKNPTNKVELATAAKPNVDIGFDQIGSKKVMDIEECVIGTKTINAALPDERMRIKDRIAEYSNGATILLRDSLRDFESLSTQGESTDSDSVVVTDHKAVVMEHVGQTKFLSPAGAFFQNNRSILPSLLAYVQGEIESHASSIADGQERFLVDAYCGSGLFSLCLASLFTRVAGVEISKDSITYANKNASLNKIDNVTFAASDAQEIFSQIQFNPDQTTAILDPPRRGCDEPFIKQLLHLGPQLIVYVSCNVHTQARDVGQIINGLPGAPKRSYQIMSLRGADLFPQTYHVEGLCVLKRSA